jgi:hypothetical protein
VIVAPRLDVGVCEEEDGEDDRDDVPTREDETVPEQFISSIAVGLEGRLT